MLDYSELNRIAAKNNGILTKLDLVYQLATGSYGELSRFSIALIDNKVVSNYYVKDKLSEAGNYDFKEQELNPDSSLGNVARLSDIRVIDDLGKLTSAERISELVSLGHRSSYTFPISYQEKTIGFVFINASQSRFFNQDSVAKDFAYLSQTVSNLFVQLFDSQRHFRSSLNIALSMGHARDPETKEHLTRMGMYSELIARLLSERGLDINHQFIHQIRQYAPLHDIGKYMIPDEILFSTNQFTPEERLVMNNHTIYGERIIEDVVGLCGPNTVSEQEVRFIKNIIRHHHEYYDGTGLPDALAGDEIPLEARIVTLADVFDALLSRRAYKPAWSVERVVEYVTQQSGIMFDPLCVDVLTTNLDQFLTIRQKYLDKVDPNQAIAC
ncbi:HD-GYP domain-containing protein [Vibrio hepatarius]|uniref:HD-GYP domain-containing protein n=1 Tax=Vibrio hepatarius TaxID=171383 RepID=UPI00148CC583|nr:HD domain-containing phosphohydrolase [Vibrio hepatarius]NOI13975.1 HD domain-containing protein [Vibrio hepatarius]